MKLTKSIVFFDLESSGTDTNTARIVQIAAIKYNPDGTTESNISGDFPIGGLFRGLDFLRRQSYLISFDGATVEEILSRGWAKFKTD